MDIDRSDTALVITDPQNDFLSPEGVAWGRRKTAELGFSIYNSGRAC